MVPSSPLSRILDDGGDAIAIALCGDDMSPLLPPPHLCNTPPLSVAHVVSLYRLVVSSYHLVSLYRLVVSSYRPMAASRCLVVLSDGSVVPLYCLIVASYRLVVSSYRPMAASYRLVVSSYLLVVLSSSQSPSLSSPSPPQHVHLPAVAEGTVH